MYVFIVLLTKYSMKRILYFITLAILLTACDNSLNNGSESNNDVVENIAFGKTSYSVTVGDIVTLEVSYSPVNAPRPQYILTSSNTNLAKIISSDDLTVEALAEGIVTISATVNEEPSLSAECTINISPLAPESISIVPSSSEIVIGETLQLSASVKPDKASASSFEWASEDTSIATVGQDGMVTGISEGTTEITVKIPGTNISSKAIVKVNPVLVSEIEIEKEVYYILVGDNAQISAKVLPENATHKDIVWKSDDNTIASVDENGVVTANKIGETVITASIPDGTVSATTYVKVCEICDFVNFSINVGTEGSTSTGFYSYIRLRIKLNIDKKINITGILLCNENNVVVDSRYDIGEVNTYDMKTITRTGSFETYKAKGWWYRIGYSYEGKNYEQDVVNN